MDESILAAENAVKENTRHSHVALVRDTMRSKKLRKIAWKVRLVGGSSTTALEGDHLLSGQTGHGFKCSYWSGLVARSETGRHRTGMPPAVFGVGIAKPFLTGRTPHGRRERTRCIVLRTGLTKPIETFNFVFRLY